MIWVVLVPAALGLGVAQLVVATQNHTRIHNTTDRTIRDASLTIRDTQEKTERSNVVESLGPGESLWIHHRLPDTRADVTFSLDGRSIEYHEHYVDLWLGEGFVFEIQNGGSVIGRHDHPRRD